MYRYLVAFGLACAALAAPAAAQSGGEWRHEGSGISLPRQIGEMSLSREQDASGGGNWDVILQYGSTDTPVTVYVYRSAFPNAALWFERTRLAMNEHVGSGSRDAAPRSFTFGGAPAPNGLREEIALQGGRSTAVAMAQVGDWMVKVRITSGSLDRTAITEAMGRLLGAFRFARPTPAPLPLTVPGPCTNDARMRGDPIRNGGPEAMAAALFVVVGDADARGRSGLAAEPRLWCRASTELPVRFGTVYRRIDATGWVALLGDSGMAAAAGPVDIPGEVRAALYASRPASTSVVALYDGIPNPDRAIPVALPVVVGQARGLAEMTIGPNPAPAPGKQ